MKHLLLGLVMLFTVGKTCIAQTTINTATISFEFVSKKVKGTLMGFKSNSNIDFDNPENSSFEGSVAVNTLDTNNSLRNWHLKGSKYFDEDKYPRISFKSESVTAIENGYLVKGLLRLKGISKPFEIKLSKNANQLEGRASLYTSDFNINIKKKREDNLVRVVFRFQLQ